MQMWLVMRTADGRERSFALDRPRTVIGRGSRCYVRVALPTVAEEHCELRTESDALVIIDLETDQGTFHNGRRVDRAALAHQDAVTIGPVTFTIRFDGVAADEQRSYADIEPKAQPIAEPPTITTRRTDQPLHGKRLGSG